MQRRLQKFGKNMFEQASVLSFKDTFSKEENINLNEAEKQKDINSAHVDIKAISWDFREKVK